jgi:hypothetical protein
MVKEERNFFCKIEALENDYAILDCRGQRLKIAKKFLAKDCRQGDILQVEFLTSGQAEKRNKNLAKAIL